MFTVPRPYQWRPLSDTVSKSSFIQLRCFQRGRHPEPITGLQESACQPTTQAVTVFQKLHRKHRPTLILTEATSSCTEGSLTQEEENHENTWSISQSRLRQDGGSWLVRVVDLPSSFVVHVAVMLCFPYYQQGKQENVSYLHSTSHYPINPLPAAVSQTCYPCAE